MANIHRAWIVATVIACFVIADGNVPLFASEASPAFDVARVAQKLARESAQTNDTRAAWNPTVDGFNAAAGQIFRGRPYRTDRSASIAALMIGAAATITGAALLIYANRPECSTNPSTGGCGYGMKVVGGSVMAGGAVGLVIGAVTWR